MPRSPSLRRRTSRTRGAITALFSTVVLGLGVGSAAVPAYAASGTVDTGTIEAQVTSLSGGTSYRLTATRVGNTYSYPSGTWGWIGNDNGPSGWVGSNGEAFGGHGANGTTKGSGNSYITTGMSAVGVTPAVAGDVNTGTPFLLGETTHYNYPISGSGNSYLKGSLQLRLGGFNDEVLNFPWELWETPNANQPCGNGESNYGSGVNRNGCADRITFESQVSDTTISQDGVEYRLVVEGFFPAGGNACPTTMPSQTQNVFWTPEEESTKACIYGSLTQVRNLTIQKQVESVGDLDIPSFSFTSESSDDGSAWQGGNFTLTPTAENADSETREILEGRRVAVTESLPEGWELSDLTCTGTNDDDVVSIDDQTVTVETSFDKDASAIVCTFTNRPDSGSVSWSKIDGKSRDLLGGSEWILTGPGPDGESVTVQDCVADSDDACDGPDKDSAEGKFRVEGLAWGEYTLTESQAPEGYDGSGEEFTFTIGPKQRDITLNPVENARKKGSATWSKVDGESRDLLGGSEWILTGPGPDGESVTVQ